MGTIELPEGLDVINVVLNMIFEGIISVPPKVLTFKRCSPELVESLQNASPVVSDSVFDALLLKAEALKKYGLIDDIRFTSEDYKEW